MRGIDRRSKTMCRTLTFDAGGAKQKGIITYGLAANRQNPVAGATHDAIFNTFRRTKSQIFYWLPVMAAGYYIMHWATERYVLLTVETGGCPIDALY